MGSHFALLRAFHARDGHANVPQRHREGNVRLGGWLHTQQERKQAREWSEAECRAKKVSDEEVSRLEVLLTEF